MEVTPRSLHGATGSCEASGSVATHCSGSQSSHVRTQPGGQDPLPGPLHVITRWYHLRIVSQRRGHCGGCWGTCRPKQTQRLSRDPPTDPNDPVPPHPQFHITSDIVTAAGFTMCFHTYDLACHHPKLMPLSTKEGAWAGPLKVGEVGRSPAHVYLSPWGTKCCISHSVVSDFETPWTVACQVPLTVEFSR